MEKEIVEIIEKYAFHLYEWDGSDSEYGDYLMITTHPLQLFWQNLYMVRNKISCDMKLIKSNKISYKTKLGSIVEFEKFDYRIHVRINNFLLSSMTL